MNEGPYALGAETRDGKKQGILKKGGVGYNAYPWPRQSSSGLCSTP